MAYTAVYGAYSSTWTPSGASTSRKVRARMYYQVTETPTTYTIQFYGQGSVYNDNLGLTLNGKLYNAGTQIGSTGSHTYTYTSGGTNHTDVYYTLVSTQTTGAITKTHSAQTRNIQCKVYRNNYESTYYSTASITLTIPAKASYAVTYNANGGSGAPSNQTKWYGENLTLSSTQPTRTGYTFNGWNTASDGSGTDYSSGQSYTTDANLTLYAKWTANTYTVVYNKNNTSATGTTASSTHTYDEAKNLTANGYSLTDNFYLGWATSENGAVTYTDGQSVTNLATSGTVDLYAVWKYMYEAPDIQTATAFRWNASEGTADDAGDAGRIQAYVSPAYKYSSLTAKAYVSTQIKASYRASGSTGSYTQLGSVQTITTPSTLTWTSGANVFDPTKQYDIQITAQVVESSVTKTSSTNSTFISVAEFILDFDENGESIGIFTTADGLTADSEKAMRIEGDIVLSLDDTVASGTDYEILQAISDLGWDVNAD